VRDFHRLAAVGQWEAALALVDLEAKALSMLGEVYAQGRGEDQAANRAIWGRKLQEVTGAFIARYFKEGPGEVLLVSQSQGRAEVVQQSRSFKLIYTLRAGETGWLIVDRTHEADGLRPKVERGMSVVLAHIEKELGRPPTLAEVNVRLEQMLDRLRERAVRVPVSPPGPPAAAAVGRDSNAHR
jgi:hypothetical protein